LFTDNPLAKTLTPYHICPLGNSKRSQASFSSLFKVDMVNVSGLDIAEYAQAVRLVGKKDSLMAISVE